MVERHAVADLLTDEQRARVRAATFETAPRPFMFTASGAPEYRCPLAVAFDLDGSPGAWTIAHRLGWKHDDPRISTIKRFINNLHRIEDPADVYILLGCVPDARRAEVGPGGGGE
jgi:hypothetical protein